MKKASARSKSPASKQIAAGMDQVNQSLSSVNLSGTSNKSGTPKRPAEQQQPVMMNTTSPKRGAETMQASSTGKGKAVAQKSSNLPNVVKVHSSVTAANQAQGKATLKVNNQEATISRTSDEKRGRGRPRAQDDPSKTGQDRTSNPATVQLGQKKKKALLRLRDDNSFQTYIFRVVKDVKPELSITKQAMKQLNQIMIHLFEMLMEEARNLLIYNKKSTLSSKEIQSAVKMMYPGELQKLGLQYGTESLAKFTQAQNN
eukprot:403356228